MKITITSPGPCWVTVAAGFVVEASTENWITFPAAKSPLGARATKARTS